MNPRLPLEKRRDKFVIIAEILQVARTGALKTQILYKAGLSFAQLTQYLYLLTSSNLLRKTAHKRKEVYETTPKGFEFLKTQQEIMGLLGRDAEGRINMKVPSESLVITTRKEGS